MEHYVEFEVDGIRKNSKDDFELEFVSYDLNFPEPKTSYTEIVGGNGSIDHTEVFGKVFYKNRKGTFNFNSKAGFDDSIRKIASFLHGKIAKITLSDDMDFYYLGRVSFNKYTSDRKNGKVVLNVEAKPYKMKQKITVQSSEITERKVVTYKNSRMEVCPIFKATNDMTFEFNGNSYAVGANEIRFTDIEFKEGDNVIIWNGTGTVTVTYQEGAF